MEIKIDAKCLESNLEMLGETLIETAYPGQAPQ